MILLDEGGSMTSMSRNKSELLQNNLRQTIDECSYSHFQGAMILYAVPDVNFLSGRNVNNIALQMRLEGLKIDLDKITPDPMFFLTDVGTKLAEIYEVENGPLDPIAKIQCIRTTAQNAINKRFGETGYKRIFVRKLIEALDRLKPQ